MAATGFAAKDWELVLDEPPAATGEDRRALGETCPLLLADVGREPSDAASVGSDGGADRGAAASVGIAQAAAAPKKTIPISPRDGEVSEKAGSGCPGDEFLGLGKSGWKPLAISRRKYLPGSAQLKANRFILTSWKGQKTNSGQMDF